MKENGQLVRRGILGAEGDVEFWDDGPETARLTTNEDESKAS